jgi:uncharacterized protein DUF4157
VLSAPTAELLAHSGPMPNHASSPTGALRAPLAADPSRRRTRPSGGPSGLQPRPSTVRPVPAPAQRVAERPLGLAAVHVTSLGVLAQPREMAGSASLPAAALPAGGGNQAVERLVPTGALQGRLRVSEPSDANEMEADQVADEVLGMTAPLAPGLLEPYGHAPGGEVQRCPGGCGPTPCGDGVAAVVPPSGQPLSDRVRAFFEPRFDRDFGHVRVHTGDDATALARSLDASAFTVGRDIVFGGGRYAPDTSAGRRLLAHELTHTIQHDRSHDGAQRVDRRMPEIDRAPSPPRVLGRAPSPVVARQLSSALCSTPARCSVPDGTTTATGRYHLTVLADKEGTFLLVPLTSKVGHSWVRLVAPNGRYWTYGFWPQIGFDPGNPTKDVRGCVHHPDTAHKPTASQTFELDGAQFAAAQARAEALCLSRPNYNLFGLQCTSFVSQILESAGQRPALGFGLIWESPSALDSWIRSNSLILGLTGSVGPQQPGITFGVQLAYTHQFLSALGSKLRLEWISRGELNARMATVATGAGLEVTSQRVYLPSAYVFGGPIAGALAPAAGPAAGERRFGAGLTGGAGLQYRVDEILTVGVEYNLVKDIVNDDPALQRLMVTAGLRLF